MTAPQLEDHVVLFLDILGFSQLIQDDRLEEVFEAVKFSHETKSVFGGEGDNTRGKLTAFSDSIVFSVPVSTPTAISTVIFFANYLFMKLLAIGVMTRGAITVGPLHHDDLVFGKALVDAAELEKHLANYPRIVLSNDAEAAFIRKYANLPKSIADLELTRIRYDFDKVPHANVFGRLGFPLTREAAIYPAAQHAEIERLVMRVMKDRPDNNRRVAAKYDWLLHYYQAECQSKAPLSPNIIDVP